MSTSGVSLPATFDLDETVGVVDPAFLESLDHDAFRALPAAEKVVALRGAGAQIGDGVDLGEGSLVVAPRVVLEDGVRLGPRATVLCEEVVAIGELSQFGADLELRCRRAYLGAGIWGGRSVRIGGGGHRDPWATLTLGDLAFVGDEAFVNVCRPVLIGREVFLTMRSLIVTHNIGHSVLEGFENRFAPVVLEDRAQVGLGAVLYAGSRIGAEAIVASNSYVVGEIPAGSFAIGVPAKATGSSSHKLSDARRLELARRFVDDLHELLALRGHAVSAIENDGFEIEGTRVAFVESYRGGVEAPAVVLALDVRGDVPEGVAVLDLLGRQVHGSGGVVLDSVREFCRKRGIRFEPGPWSYPGRPHLGRRLGPHVRERREHRAYGLDIPLDGDRAEIALDHEVIEARAVPDDNGVGVLESPLRIWSIDHCSNLAVDPELDSAVRVLQGKRDAERAR